MKFTRQQMVRRHNKMYIFPGFAYRLAECVQKTNSERKVEINLSMCRQRVL
jgi:hypothetical protein